MHPVPLDIFAHCAAHDRAVFRCRDNYSLSEQRACRLITPDTEVAWEFQAPASRPDDDAMLCLQMRASLEIFDSHAYVGRHINSLLRDCFVAK